MARHFVSPGSPRKLCAGLVAASLLLTVSGLSIAAEPMAVQPTQAQPTQAQPTQAEPAVIHPTLKPAAKPIAAKPVAIAWHATVDSAWKTSQKDRRPMLVFFTTEGCAYCTLMERETFHNQQVAGAVTLGFIPVSVNAAQAPKLAEQLKLRAYPTTVIISPDKHVLDTITGYVSAEKLSERLTDITNKGEVAKR